MEWSIQEELLFREEAFVVSLQLSDEEQFTVEVQSSDTADQWRATFEKEYIEELTHKTGNFKQSNYLRFYEPFSSAIKIV